MPNKEGSVLQKAIEFLTIRNAVLTKVVKENLNISDENFQKLIDEAEADYKKFS